MGLGVLHTVTVLVHVGDVFREVAVQSLVGSILCVKRMEKCNEDEEDQVESREKSRREVDVLSGRLADVVAAVEGVGGAEKRYTRVECCLDARFGERNRLLLHDLSVTFSPDQTSWIDVRSMSFILSNSSMQQMPLSARISAPPSTFSSFVSGSRNTPAVNPTLEEPFPCASPQSPTLTVV